MRSLFPERVIVNYSANCILQITKPHIVKELLGGDKHGIINFHKTLYTYLPQ